MCARPSSPISERNPRALRAPAIVTEELEVAVVGAGIVGLATAEALIRRGAEVRCFEAARPGDAQSGGLTRIFRHRHDDERLVELAVESRRGCAGAGTRSGRTLIRAGGWPY